MSMLINDNDVCPKCGAYWCGNGFCSNGHPRDNPKPHSDATIADFKEAYAKAKRTKNPYTSFAGFRFKTRLVHHLFDMMGDLGIKDEDSFASVMKQIAYTED